MPETTGKAIEKEDKEKHLCPWVDLTSQQLKGGESNEDIYTGFKDIRQQNEESKPTFLAWFAYILVVFL